MPDAAEERGLGRQTAAWLVAGTVLLLFANGRWTVPAATWLAPAALLVYLDRTKPWTGLAWALVLFVLVQFVVWWELIPAPGFLYFLIAGVYGAVYFLPFVAHRTLTPRLRGPSATLVFPLAWVAVEFVFHSWVTPYGTWFSLAYTQTGWLTLMQLASVTGTAGVSFLIAWFAAILAWSVQNASAKPPSRPAARRIVSTHAVVLAAVLGLGHLRLAGQQDGGESIRAAGLVPDPALMRQHEETLLPVRRGEPLTADMLVPVSRTTARLNEDLFRRTRREAAAGARLIAWSETAGRVLRADEQAFLERAGAIARDHGVTLMLGYGVLDPDAPKPFNNKVVAVDANGAARWQYQKANPIVGAESPLVAAGDGVVRSVSIDGAVVAAVICHDLDFPRLFRQVADSGVALMVGPSADWREITPLHANMAVPRAIENGFSLFRPTSGGRSIAVDTRGRALATVDYADDAIVAYLPTAPSRTVYGVVGDLFSWLCVAGFAVVGVIAWTRPPKPATGA